MNRRLLLILLALVMLAPSFTYNLWPQMVPFGWTSERFMTGEFDLKGQVLPSVYGEVRTWLNDYTSSQDMFRLFWLPVDPAVLSTLSFLYPDTPVFFPRFEERNYTQLIFSYMSNAPSFGWNGLGRLFANANVKYIIVNLSANEGGGIWKQNGPPALLPWGPSWDLTYYFTGDPNDYAKILDREQRLSLVAQETHFLAYENLDFVPYVSVYPGAFLVSPKNMLNQTTPLFSVHNYSDNLLLDGGFENGLLSWNLAGNWQTSTYAHSGGVSIEGRNLENGWIVASQDFTLSGNRSYYLSGWMRIENARQSHVKLLFYDDAGNQLLAKQPQSGTDGTRDWWQFSDSDTSPPGTARVTIGLLGGWSLDGLNAARAWFDDVRFVEGYYPITSPVRNWQYDILLASSVGNLVSDIPGFENGKNLIASGDMFAPTEGNVERMKQFALISNGLVFLGDASPQKETEWAFQLPRLLFVYEAESVLQPLRGNWQHVQGPSLSNHRAAEISGEGQAVQNFRVGRNGYYTIAVRVANEEDLVVNVDGANLSIVPFVDSLGQMFKWYQSEGQFLGLGTHKLTVSATGNSTTFDKILMISSIERPATLEDLAGDQVTNLDFTRLSTTQYRVRMESRGPSFIVLGESFDPSWNAHLSGLKLNHYPLPLHMYWSNLFRLEKAGQSTVELSFDKQESRNVLIASWGVAWVSSVMYLSYGLWPRVIHALQRWNPRKSTRT